MYRFLLTPRWWGINVFVVLAIPFCLFMGSWQLSRFEARVESHKAAEDRPDPAKARAEPLRDLLPVTQDTSGRTASATGRYDARHQLLVPDRQLDEKRGYYVLTLLRIDGAEALPVVRGWLPGDANRAKAPAPPSGRVSVSGALQATESQNTDGVQPSAGLPSGQLGMINAASLVNLVPYQVSDAWITLHRTTDGMHPVPPAAAPGSGLDLKAFQNLGYTGEWFVFAGFVVFMWFRLIRRETEAARDLALGLVPDDPAAPTAPTAAPAPATPPSQRSADSAVGPAIGAATGPAGDSPADSADPADSVHAAARNPAPNGAA
ncbi:SURF1 family protein [Streptomyces sp. H27-D2]|uniref:SURF1 family protein n=1 Tax=Streptomyces sp. H27-D2 TaxID=3046304 RepID=UPI002DB79627|nr:SURF1 family protein [Streptomyces sp. H27-D2]MEC4014953.1 SURF1 family protein [Streptomyces sp. H27-D2]